MMAKITKEKYEQANIVFDQIRKIAIGFIVLPIVAWIAAILIKQQFIIYKPFLVIIVINLGVLFKNYWRIEKW